MKQVALFRRTTLAMVGLAAVVGVAITLAVTTASSPPASAGAGDVQLQCESDKMQIARYNTMPDAGHPEPPVELAAKMLQYLPYDERFGPLKRELLFQNEGGARVALTESDGRVVALLYFDNNAPHGWVLTADEGCVS